MRRDFARSLNEMQPASADVPRAAHPQSAQQAAALAALAVRRGEAVRASLRGPARELYETLTESQLLKLAGVGRSDGEQRAGTSGGAAPRVYAHT